MSLNKAITRIAFAPNAFKECLSASQACKAMQLGVDKASGKSSALRIVSVPDDVVDIHGWHISDYDGCESVHQSHWVG